MALHFSEQELAERRKRICASMAADGLDGLLIFRQETMFYLTGYDTFGYVFFQCLYLGADGKMTFLTRSADLRQAKHTSVIEDVRIWVDHPDAQPAVELAGILREHGCDGQRLGVEYESYGLTAQNGKRLEAALDGFCTLVDASELVTRLRVVKSAAEIAYVRRAAELADEALMAVEASLKPGNIVWDAFQAHADVIDCAGMGQHRLNACGYSLGTTFEPNWMDWPMLYADNPVEIEADMVYFYHMIIFDSDAELAMCLGETVLTTSGTAERLSRSSLDLIHVP